MSGAIKMTPRVVATITPQRIGFVGGGTDLPAYYELNNGEVISSTIDKYIYVTVKKHSPLFNEAYRLSYSKTEHVDRLDDIENDIARECLRLVPVEPPLYIATAADLPASSGLGSSSSFAVGLLNALHLLRGERVSPAQLAEEACEVEIGILNNPIGKQDQYAAAFGGLNHFFFKKNGRVDIDHLFLPNDLLNNIFKNSLLVWSGLQRDASAILAKQNNNLKTNAHNYQNLILGNEKLKNIFLNPPSTFLEEVGGLLENGWSVKKGLEDSISSSEINQIHSQILELGGLGGKLCGAGGGGFLFELIPSKYHEEVFKVFGQSRVLRVNYEPHGSRVLYELY
ncbi:GHMP kinase [Polynucleobacter paneuropaeus]|nr:GHMP kinase [Polynucleobacter paneuropaeus]